MIKLTNISYKPSDEDESEEFAIYLENCYIANDYDEVIDNEKEEYETDIMFE